MSQPDSSAHPDPRFGILRRSKTVTVGQIEEPSFIGDMSGRSNSQQSLEERIKFLESRLEDIDLDQKTDPGGKTESLLFKESEQDNDEPSQTMPTIAKVRTLRYKEYKNRTSNDDCRYAIDVLEAGALLEQEIEQELKDRSDVTTARSRKKNKAKGGKGLKGSKDGLVGDGVSIMDKAVHTSTSDVVWVQRVRIQSPALLTILARLSGETWSMRPRSFWRPFRPLVGLQDQMREVLNDLGNKWGSNEVSTPLSSKDGSGQEPLRPSSYLDESLFRGGHQLDDSVEALRDMRCYVKFIDDKIMPLWSQFDGKSELTEVKKPDGTLTGVRVRFDDLWFLFRAGELVYRPVKDESADKAHLSSIRQTAWRVISNHPPLPRYKVNSANRRRFSDNDEDEEGESDFVLYCYYIDYTGDEFCIVTQKFCIRPFSGDKKIRSLDIFPIRFKPNHQKLLSEFDQKGKDFLRYIEEKHFSYNWWTTTCGPKGEPITDGEGNEIKHPTHVNSEVIVDFVEAFQVNPLWKPQAVVIKPLEGKSLSTADEVLIKEWCGSKLVRETPELVQLCTGIDMMERNRNVMEGKFLSSVRDNARAGRFTTAQYLQPEDYCILPKRVYAYILSDRKFAQIDARRIRSILGSHNGFDSLKINPSHKKMIQALVESHFINKKIERQHGVEGISQDLIQGKGRGLVILLHGVPGVGKTATAEAVAQANRKPLFALSCGDLGVTPKDVETALHEIFRLASIWDAILLLDEVDTFFSQRSRSDADITKNALVSVFLRVLEYYNGILFLTTNRPGALDEAFKSRVQVSIYYPPLSESQTREIWEMNLDRIKTIEDQRSKSTNEQPLQVFDDEVLRFARDHYKRHSQPSRWNGRQIKNAFQIAASLAYYEMRAKYSRQLEQDPDAKPSRPVLGSEHFQTVDLLTSDFDDYMTETMGGQTDAEIAFENNYRADHFEKRTFRLSLDEHDHGSLPTITDQTPPSGAYGGAGGGFGRGGINEQPYHDGGRRLVSSVAHDFGGRGGGSGGGWDSDPQLPLPQPQSHYYQGGGRGGRYSDAVGGSSESPNGAFYGTNGPGSYQERAGVFGGGGGGGGFGRHGSGHGEFPSPPPPQQQHHRPSGVLPGPSPSPYHQTHAHNHNNSGHSSQNHGLVGHNDSGHYRGDAVGGGGPPPPPPGQGLQQHQQQNHPHQHQQQHHQQHHHQQHQRHHPQVGSPPPASDYSSTSGLGVVGAGAGAGDAVDGLGGPRSSAYGGGGGGAPNPRESVEDIAGYGAGGRTGSSFRGLERHESQ